MTYNGAVTHPLLIMLLLSSSSLSSASCFLFYHWLSFVITLLYKSEPVTNNLPSWFRCTVKSQIFCHWFAMYNIAANIGIAVYLADWSMILQLLHLDWDWKEKKYVRGSEQSQTILMSLSIHHCVCLLIQQQTSIVWTFSCVTSSEHNAKEELFILVLFQLAVINKTNVTVMWTYEVQVVSTFVLKHKIFKFYVMIDFWYNSYHLE
jgi:hypothetical protein